MSFEAILYLAVLVLAARLGGELLHRIKQPTILGNVLAGIIVGPTLFAIVEPIDEIEIFISIGVFFLFFLIGLEEIDLPALFRIFRKRIFAGSAIGFVVPFFVAILFSQYLEMDFVKSFAIASVIGASSLGVTATILTELGKLKSTIGLEIFTVTAIIEFIAIVFTSVAIQIGSIETQPSIVELGWLFGKILIFFAIAGSFAVFIFPKIIRLIKKYLKVREIYFGIVIGVILLVAYFAEISGVHGAIGALLLGIAVSRMPKQEYTEISKGLHAIGYGIFIPIFFAGIGLYFLPTLFELPLVTVIGFIAVIIAGKFGGSYIASYVARLKPRKTVTYGTMSKGAVDLALMLSLLSAGILDSELFSLLVLGTLIMMTISGITLQNSLRRESKEKVEVSDVGLMPVYFRRVLSNYTAKDIMSDPTSRITKDVYISEFVATHLDTAKSTYLLLNNDNKLTGAVSIREINSVPQKKWKNTKISNVIDSQIAVVTADEYLYTIIQKMNLYHFDLIPVVDSFLSRKVIGIITSSQIMNLLLKHEEAVK